MPRPVLGLINPRKISPGDVGTSQKEFAKNREKNLRKFFSWVGVLKSARRVFLAAGTLCEHSARAGALAQSVL